MSDLKPCPCCGGEAKAECYVLEGAVRCQRCGLSMAREHGRFDDLGYPEAIAAWNRRAPARDGSAD